MKNNAEVRKEAAELFKAGVAPIEIARKLNVPEGNIRVWKSRYHWEGPVRASGGQAGNQNAKGHGAPKGNQNSRTHGLFSKYADKETLEIMKSVETKSPLDLIWDAILIQYSSIVRSMRIMHVNDKDDKTVEKIGSSDGAMSSSEQWEIQQAWDKQGNYLKALARATDALRSLIKDYLELEGQSKSDAKKNAEDWKSAVVEIAKRRSESLSAGSEASDG